MFMIFVLAHVETIQTHPNHFQIQGSIIALSFTSFQAGGSRCRRCRVHISWKVLDKRDWHLFKSCSQFVNLFTLCIWQFDNSFDNFVLQTLITAHNWLIKRFLARAVVDASTNFIAACNMPCFQHNTVLFRIAIYHHICITVNLYHVWYAVNSLAAPWRDLNFIDSWQNDHHWCHNDHLSYLPSLQVGLRFNCTDSRGGSRSGKKSLTGLDVVVLLPDQISLGILGICLIVFDALTNLPSMASSSAVLFLRSKLYNEIRLACEAWQEFLLLHLKLCFLLVASLPGCFVIILLYVYTHCWLLLSQYDDAGSLRANVMFAGWKEEGSSPKWQSGSKVSPGMFGNMQWLAFYDSSLWAWKWSFHLDILLLS